ncbi:metal ABC transporter permease [bacterium]|nr:metal ABC transporter permease [bacterium]
MLSAFHDSFLQIALAASLIVGAVCAYLGVYVVLRRIVFVGAALAQVSSAGVGLALCTGYSPSIVSLILTLGGVAAFSVKSKDRRTTQESLIGIGYALASALAVLFVAKSAQGEGRMLDVLSGNILTVTPGQVWLMACAGIASIAVHSLLSKQFLFSMFDPETARACGIKSGWWDLLFFLILGVIISLAIRLAGTLLVFAFLVIPAVTGLLVSQRLSGIYIVALGSSAIATVCGLYASFQMDLPSGPAIVACLFVLLIAGWLISKFRH